MGFFSVRCYSHYSSDAHSRKTTFRFLASLLALGEWEIYSNFLNLELAASILTSIVLINIYIVAFLWN